MITILPFICLAAGAVINWKGLPKRVLDFIDIIINISVVMLMVVIGLNIGINETVIKSLPTIGLNCVLICWISIAFSVLFSVIFEKKFLQLDKLKEQLSIAGKIESVLLKDEDASKESQNSSPLIVVIPVSIIVGLIMGVIFFDDSISEVLNVCLMICLTLLYTGVGISLASNKSVFSYIKQLGVKLLLLPVAVFLGCGFGGILSCIILKLPPEIAVVSAGGMGYYSITGSFMMQTYGVLEGTYGFIVNVMREFFTVLFLPFLVKISKGSAIVSGAAGDMDTMLVPVTKMVGEELSVIVIITGTVLTIITPFWLPAMVTILGIL